MSSNCSQNTDSLFWRKHKAEQQKSFDESNNTRERHQFLALIDHEIHTFTQQLDFIVLLF